MATCTSFGNFCQYWQFPPILLILPTSNEHSLECLKCCCNCLQKVTVWWTTYSRCTVSWSVWHLPTSKGSFRPLSVGLLLKIQIFTLGSLSQSYYLGGIVSLAKLWTSPLPKALPPPPSSLKTQPLHAWWTSLENCLGSPDTSNIHQYVMLLMRFMYVTMMP